ncbi:hypothetical protein K431DRAFT_289706 [Polychaeton citri CBS 116435]|uniref:Uncharacterized protein n=1 Tax=Polychaeton citri CBS 116435 TaxID=1314669 RepID=A0A9P4PYC0_9PEZI|nr:hypothetical protein K431DRAFT_289706 [Polychaeton citri CBS 116435]
MQQNRLHLASLHESPLPCLSPFYLLTVRVNYPRITAGIASTNICIIPAGAILLQ